METKYNGLVLHTINKSPRLVFVYDKKIRKKEKEKERKENTLGQTSKPEG